MSGWSRSQCVEFARDIRDAWRGKAWATRRVGELLQLRGPVVSAEPRVVRLDPYGRRNVKLEERDNITTASLWDSFVCGAGRDDIAALRDLAEALRALASEVDMIADSEGAGY